MVRFKRFCSLSIILLEIDSYLYLGECDHQSKQSTARSPSSSSQTYCRFELELLIWAKQLNFITTHINYSYTGKIWYFHKTPHQQQPGFNDQPFDSFLQVSLKFGSDPPDNTVKTHLWHKQTCTCIPALCFGLMSVTPSAASFCLHHPSSWAAEWTLGEVEVNSRDAEELSVLFA